MVLDSFIKTSATGGLGSIKAEVMADTAVALASGNVKLVSSKVRSLSSQSGHARTLSASEGHSQMFCIDARARENASIHFVVQFAAGVIYSFPIPVFS